MLCFDRCFLLLPSTTVLLLLLSSLFLLTTSIPCIYKRYNPDVKSEELVQTGNTDCFTEINECIEYICKIDGKMYFGEGCMGPVIRRCRLNINVPSILQQYQTNGYVKVQGQYYFGKVDSYASMFIKLMYYEYMAKVKPFGNDSLQERDFWIIREYYDPMQYSLWTEKAKTIIPNFANDVNGAQPKIQSKMNVKKEDLDSVTRDLEDIQKAANQSSPKSEYFQKKYAEMKLKLNDIESCTQDWLENVQTCASSLNETINKGDTLLNKILESLHPQKFTYKIIRENMDDFTRTVTELKAWVLDFLKFANEDNVDTFYCVSNGEYIDFIYCVYDYEIDDFHSDGNEARKAVIDFENEKEFQHFTDVIHDAQTKIVEKVKDIKESLDSISRDLEDIQKAANQSLPESKYFEKKYVEIQSKLESEAVKFCAKNLMENVQAFNNESNKILENKKLWLNEMPYSPTEWNIKHDFDISQITQLTNETMNSVSCFSNDEIGYFQSVGYEARKALEDFESDNELKDLIKEVKNAVKEVKKIGEAAQKTAENAQKVADESKTIGMNADNAARNASQTAEDSKMIGKAANIVAENAKNVADESKKAGEDAKLAAKNEMEALRSNGRKNGEFEAASILSFIVFLFI